MHSTPKQRPSPSKVSQSDETRLWFFFLFRFLWFIKRILLGNVEKRYSWVHVEDLSNAYVKIAQSTQYLGGQVFNIVSRDYPSFEEIVVASALAQGFDRSQLKVVRAPADSPMFETNVILDPHKAERLLGWQARHVGFVAEMPIYFKAWKRSLTLK